MSAIGPPVRAHVRLNDLSDSERVKAFVTDFAQMDMPEPMSNLTNWALTDLMRVHPEMVIMGEYVGRDGGAYGLTQKMLTRFGASRIVDALLDEQSIRDLEIGMVPNGFIPMPEVQFLAYLHNAEDQLRSEAAALPFFSHGELTTRWFCGLRDLGIKKALAAIFTMTSFWPCCAIFRA